MLPDATRLGAHIDMADALKRKRATLFIIYLFCVNEAPSHNVFVDTTLVGITANRFKSMSLDLLLKILLKRY